MKRLLLPIFFSIGFIPLASGSILVDVSSSKHEKSEIRKISNSTKEDNEQIVINESHKVHSVSWSVLCNVRIAYSETPKVVIRGDKRYIESLDIKYSNGEMIINSAGTASYSSDDGNKVTVELYQPTYKNFSVSGVGSLTGGGAFKNSDIMLQFSGAANANLENLQCKTLNANISGTGSVTLSGSADAATYNVSGVGNIDAMDFIVSVVSANVSGMGDIKCYVFKELNSNVSGMGNIYYKGNPKIVNSNSKPERVDKKTQKTKASNKSVPSTPRDVKSSPTEPKKRKNVIVV